VKPRVASAIVTTGALAYAAAAPRLSRRNAAAAAVAASAAGVAVGRAAGCSWADLGLDRAHMRRGALIGTVCGAPIAAAIVAAARRQSTGHYFSDARVVDVADGDVAYEVLVRIPVVTTATEEILFRSVLLAVASEWLGAWRGAVWTSLVFGAWHVVPALHSLRHNPAVAAGVDAIGGRTAYVGMTVAGTAIAGLGLGALRARAKSVVAPMVVHAVVNGVAFVASRAAAAART
jgi:membrane protease YdiL (CAAX protease family)